MASKKNLRPFVLVRIKTFNRGLGHVARRYTFQGKRFDIDIGWYKVGRSMAAELSKERHPSTGAEIFDAVELEVAEELVEAEATEAWSAGQLAPDRGTDVKVKDFVRREEIKAAQAASGPTTDEGWDDESPERSVSRAASPSAEATPKKVTRKTGTSTSTGKKKSVKRRSATK